MNSQGFRGTRNATALSGAIARLNLSARFGYVVEDGSNRQYIFALECVPAVKNGTLKAEEPGFFKRIFNVESQTMTGKGISLKPGSKVFFNTDQEGRVTKLTL